MRSIPRRTATSIRSIGSKRIGHEASPREKYLQLAKIEFEKTHQTNHLQQAMERAGDCEARLAEIDREQGYLLTSAVAVRRGEPMPSEVPRRVKPAAPRRQTNRHNDREG